MHLVATSNLGNVHLFLAFGRRESKLTMFSNSRLYVFWLHSSYLAFDKQALVVTRYQICYDIIEGSL